MNWGEGIKIILMWVAGGLVVGLLLSFVILRTQGKPFWLGRGVGDERLDRDLAREQARDARWAARLEKIARKEVAKLARMQAKEARKTMVAEEKAKESAERLARKQAKKAVREVVGGNELVPEPVAGPPEPAAPDLLAEVEVNLKVATRLWTGELLPFQTRIWDDSSDEIRNLPASVREELSQAYVDMRLANSLVWVSTELGRQSKELDNNYMRLCASIAAVLDNMLPALKIRSR